MTLAAHTRGCAGLVIDGAVRDADAILDIGFPVFTRALCIKGTTKRHGGRVEVAIECGGTRVEPGDIIVGDRDGIVVIPLRDLDEVLNVARARIEKEEWVRSEIRKGRSTVELLGLESSMRSAGLE